MGSVGDFTTLLDCYSIFLACIAEQHNEIYAASTLRFVKYALSKFFLFKVAYSIGANIMRIRRLASSGMSRRVAHLRNEV
jgi:hypothetical protein